MKNGKKLSYKHFVKIWRNGNESKYISCKQMGIVILNASIPSSDVGDYQ